MSLEVRRTVRVLSVLTGVILVLNIMALRSVRQVTVVVNGEATTIRTFTSTVADAVAAVGADFDAEDMLIPAADAPLIDGTSIELVHARPVTFRIDGVDRSIDAPVLTVGDVLEELDLPYAPDQLWLSHVVTAAIDGLTLSIRLPRDVTIAVDGEVRHLTTTMLTVADALAEAGVELGPDDFVEPTLDAELGDGDSIKVARVSADTLVIHEAIPYETLTRETDELYRGDSRVVQEGVEGVRHLTYRLTLVDGVETERELVEDEITSEPTPKIVEHGTKDYPPGVNGIDEGLASWYGCGDGFHGQRTASGEIYDEQAMTAAHRSLPFGTIVTVESHETGRSVQVRINDRGPAAWTGKIIDLSCAAMIELAGVKDGSHPVTITW